ncbi:MAG: hypothetical protein HY689_14840 [Chloroflexi bacterium]|nr:hypothetical protein [Chloroflexota bacterium]
MRRWVVVRLLVDLPDEATGGGRRQDEEAVARRHISELLGKLPTGLLADFEVLRVEKSQPGKAIWSE